jgi:glutathione synthase
MTAPRQKRLKVALQMNALEALTKPTDTTLYVAQAAARRGYELFHYEPGHMRLETDPRRGMRITARGHALAFPGATQDSARYGAASTRDLGDFDVIFMRQDPPFDLAYVAATHMLEHLTPKVRIVNDPVGVRNAPEKLVTTHFPDLMPPSLITRDQEAICAFRARHGDIVFKPLFGFAGYGIFRLRADDGNLHALLEMMASLNPEPWQVQKYLPAINSTGDKRIILLDGEPVGCFTRIPAKDDSRGNMRVGGRPKPARLTPRDREICRKLAPSFRKQGLYLVGIDIIGEYLTEVNVTSPTGLVVADRLEGRKGKHTIAEMFWDRLFK